MLASEDVDDDQETEYERVLQDYESAKLYGTTPVIWDLDKLQKLFNKGQLNLAPKYQRGYVWKADRASRLIVTALCNRLVPGIVLHEREKGEYEVIDGKQRVTTLLAFYLAGEDPAAFERLQQQIPRVYPTLEKLDENYDELDGLTFAQLSRERQLSLGSYGIACTLVPYGTPKGEVFSCYEDINSGGEDLKAQQLRRAVYNEGGYIDLLDRLADSDDFKAIRDPQAFRAKKYALDPKESDRELVLRAFAFSNIWKRYKRPVKKFLNAELEAMPGADGSDDAGRKSFLSSAEAEFLWVMRVWRSVFADTDGAFRVWAAGKSGVHGWGKSVSTPLWDVLYGVLVELRISYPSEATYLERAGEIQRRFKRLFEDGELDLSGACTVSRLQERREILFETLKDILRDPPSGSRSGSRSFRDRDRLVRHLYETQGGKCSVCRQPLDEDRLWDGDYVHLDHIHPHSAGGASTVQNAGLAHKACNLKKGARTA